MLTGAGFSDNLAFTHPFGQQRLTQYLIGFCARRRAVNLRALKYNVVRVPAVMFWHFVSAVGRPRSFLADRRIAPEIQDLFAR
ncbi:Uncharacterised protein [Salmonella enterica subsp. enterica serovar Typhimurium]|nr:Uncharacterised protein [Salmonella enterica subsp. enterica serovar Typhimurium]